MHLPAMTPVLLALAWAASAAHYTAAYSLWPFPEKPFRAEGWADVGALGLGEGEGGAGAAHEVLAFGDWNGDQALDILALSSDRRTLQVYLWDQKLARFTSSPKHTLTHPHPIFSATPGDYDADGRLDVLVLSAGGAADGEQGPGGGWWGGAQRPERVEGSVYRGTGDGFEPSPHPMDAFTHHLPTVIDYHGRLQLDLLGTTKGARGAREALKLWRNTGDGGFEAVSDPLQPPDKVCQLATAHSNAFVDMDGDCRADIFLTCESGRRKSFQVWKSDSASVAGADGGGYRLLGEWDLPDGAGAISFADMDRDGTLDLVFPACRSYNAGSGIGTGCALHLLYNRQIPLCADRSADWLKIAGQAMAGKAQGRCRKGEELCSADEGMSFSMDPGDDSFTSIPLEDLFPGTSTLQFAHPSSDSGPFTLIPLKIGDYDQDGFPDVLALVVNATARPGPGGLFGGGRAQGTQIGLLRNVRCKKGRAGCGEKSARRTLQRAGDKGIDALDGIWDARSVSWVDVGEGGSLDIMVQRTGAQAESRVTLIQNNLFHDAFFLKATMLNGACDGTCEVAATAEKYPPYSSTAPGATYKFTLTDSAGSRVAAQASNGLGQTGPEGLSTTYSYIGLGRTNNYVENLFVGSSLRQADHFTILEGIIPNSRLTINPPRLPNEPSSDPARPIRASSAWHKELYLRPGDWAGWVVAVLIGLMIALGGVVWGLHQNEKREDEMERRRALHSINFQAL